MRKLENEMIVLSEDEVNNPFFFLEKRQKNIDLDFRNHIISVKNENDLEGLKREITDFLFDLRTKGKPEKESDLNFNLNDNILIVTSKLNNEFKLDFNFRKNVNIDLYHQKLDDMISSAYNQNIYYIELLLVKFKNELIENKINTKKVLYNNESKISISSFATFFKDTFFSEINFGNKELEQIVDKYNEKIKNHYKLLLDLFDFLQDKNIKDFKLDDIKNKELYDYNHYKLTLESTSNLYNMYHLSLYKGEKAEELIFSGYISSKI